MRSARAPSAAQRRYEVFLAVVFVAMAAALASRVVFVRHSDWFGYLLDAVFGVLMFTGAWTFGRHAHGRRRMLEDGRRQLEERYAELEQFTGRLAHDIRGPIAVAQTSCELAIRSSREPRVHELMNRSLRGLARANAIIGGLLDFARSGAHPDPGARTNIQVTTADLLAGIRPEADRAGVELVASEVPGVFAACSEGVYLSLLGNLTRNAIKYIGSGARRRIEIRVRLRERAVRVEVADTGLGIAKDDKCSLFDPYFRVQGVRPDGIGLGLPTVKKLAESHGGSVGVDSVLGAGSTFWFELPTAGTSGAETESSTGLAPTREAQGTSH